MSERRFHVLVCGSREWTDRDSVTAMLDGLVERHGSIVVIEGGARGADSVAAGWAKGNPHKRTTEQRDAASGGDPGIFPFEPALTGLPAVTVYVTISCTPAAAVRLSVQADIH